MLTESSKPYIELKRIPINIIINDPNNPPFVPNSIELPDHLNNLTHVKADYHGTYDENVASLYKNSFGTGLDINLNEFYYRGHSGYDHYSPSVKYDAAEVFKQMKDSAHDCFIPSSIATDQGLLNSIAKNPKVESYLNTLEQFARTYPNIIIPDETKPPAQTHSIPPTTGTTTLNKITHDILVDNEAKISYDSTSHSCSIEDSPKRASSYPGVYKKVGKSRATFLPDTGVNDVEKRKRHNDNEQARRRHVSDLFTKLATALDPSMVKRPAKAVILSKAIEFINRAHREDLPVKCEEAVGLFQERQQLVDQLAGLYCEKLPHN